MNEYRGYLNGINALTSTYLRKFDFILIIHFESEYGAIKVSLIPIIFIKTHQRNII